MTKRGHVRVDAGNSLAANAPAELLRQMIAGPDPTRTHCYSQQKATWQCPICDFVWTTKIFYRTNRGHNCPACVNHAVSEKNNLAATNPELAKEFSSKNLPLAAKDVVAGTARKLWWRCLDCGHEWQAAGYMRVTGTHCPACTGRAATPKNNLAIRQPELTKEYDPANPLPPTAFKPFSNKKVGWICDQCGYRWQANIASRTNGRGCPECARKRQRRPRKPPKPASFAEQFPKLAEEYATGNSISAKKLLLNGNDPIIRWQCRNPKCRHLWQARLSARLDPKTDIGCPECDRHFPE
ncbi:MAG: zinc-ribbon domain-containing protein [bacterium]|nr:zinc-ribbon domain-containing protein [bacterium]